MDLDADGIKDILTGCFEGGLYIAKGTGNGDFETPEKVLDADDNILRLGQYWDDEENEWTGVEGSEFKEYLGISGHAVDFDEDGDFDLLLGSNEGFLFLRENIGSASEPKFATESTQLKSKGEDEEDEKPLKTGDGHAMPIVFDWNNDGKFDIITGRNNGSVMWAENIGTKGKPLFTPLTELIDNKIEDAEGVPVGMRAQVAAGDIDNDGYNDILVGDYNTHSFEEKKEQTKEQKEEFKAAQKELMKIAQERMKLETELNELKESDDDEASEKIEQGEAELEELMTRIEKASDAYRKIAPKREMHGFVWLFKGKASEAKSESEE